MIEFDAIVVGSGQGGNPLVTKLAGDGKRVAIIERGLLGGTCINTGCTPTKAMAGSAQVAHYAREAERWGVHAGAVSVSLAEILDRKDRIVAQSRSGWEKKFEGKDNPRLFRGQAAFTGVREVSVNGETLTAPHIFIDTGTHPIIPKIAGLETVHCLTSDDMICLRELPRHLAVIGGGYVGLEFAQMFRRFGSEVTVIQNGPRILLREDEDITAELTRALEAEGIRFHLNTNVAKAFDHDGEICLDLGEGETVKASHVLVATGRAPNTRGLGLDKTGVAVDERGFVKVDGQLRTNVEGIWALGDVTGGPQFTHISYNDFQIVYANVYQGQNLSTRDRLVPYAVYTDPTLGRVGMTEGEARAAGRKIKVGRVPMSWVARAIERGETAGCMKIVVDADNDLVLGAAILSSEGGELVQILSTLMLTGRPYTLLKGAIYIHPTLAEGFFSLTDSVK